MSIYIKYYNIYNGRIDNNEHVSYEIIDNIRLWTLGDQIYRVGGPAYQILHNSRIIYEAWYRNGKPYSIKYYDRDGKCIKTIEDGKR